MVGGRDFKTMTLNRFSSGEEAKTRKERAGDTGGGGSGSNERGVSREKRDEYSSRDRYCRPGNPLVAADITHNLRRADDQGEDKARG